MTNGAAAGPHAREEGDSLAPASVTYWRISELVSAGVSSVTAFVVAGAMTFYIEQIWLAFVGAGLVLVASATWALLTPALRYRRFRFSLQGSRLWIRSGVFFHREKSIPLARIQHVDVSRGPLERMFGLARVSVFTAGGRLATAQIPGLEPSRADALRLALLQATESLAQGEA